MTAGGRGPLATPGVWGRQVLVMVDKELRQLVRDRALGLFVLYAFTLNIFIAGDTAPVDLRDAPVLVRDGDRSAASRELIARFRPPHFRIAGEVTGPEQALRGLDQGRARLVLEIPPGFGETLSRGEESARVQVLVDTSMVILGYLAASYSGQIGAEFGRDWRESRRDGLDRVPAIESRRRIWFNPALAEAWFNSISELLSMTTVIGILLPAAAMVREKERGTIEQLLVSPISPFQVMLAKVLAMVVVVLAGTAISLFGVMRPAFGVPVRGSVVLFFAVTGLYAFTTSGLGLVIGTFATRSGQVGLLVFLVVMPIILLSGTYTLFEAMPGWLRYAVGVSPLHHFVRIAYGILLRGAGWAGLWDAVLAMAVLGGGLFAVGVRRYRTQFGSGRR